MRTLQFQRVLGSGAFGTVYLAEMLGARGFRRQIAVKVLLNNHPDGPLFLSRVRDEARLLGLLQDDHILKVLELIRVEGRDAVIMEYVEGVDLGELTAAKLRPPARALAELGAAVAGALHRAHTATHPSTNQPLAVIHRDVKPANIMVTLRGGVKLLDFGVASARFEARESKTGQFVLGTLNYMAPEYIVTGEVSPKADIYGLALTIWEVICGEVYGQPRLKKDQHETRLAERLARIPASHQAFVPILRRMLAWNPSDRPDGSEVERNLMLATDAVTGIGLRTWTGEAVAKVLGARPANPQDPVGLGGRTIHIADESADSTVELRMDQRPSVPPAVVPPAPPARPRKAKKKAGINWQILVLQAVLLGAGFGMLMLFLLTALLFLRKYY